MSNARSSWAVVIPAYNEAERIADALDSLARQTEPADEIVVCDDGSQDNLQGALAPFRDMITLVRQPNRGLAAARNTGAMQVRDSDWILFLDADDYVDENYLEASRDAVVKDPSADIVCSDALGFSDLDGSRLYRHLEREPFPRGSQRSAIVASNFMLTVSVRRSRYFEVGGFDESMRLCEDYECWLRLILTGSHVALAEGTFLHRRHHGHNLSSRRPEMIAWRMEVIRRAINFHGLSDTERLRALASLERNSHHLNMLLARRTIHDWIEKSTSDESVASGRMQALRLLGRHGPLPRQRAALALGVVSPTLTGRLAARLR